MRCRVTSSCDECTAECVSDNRLKHQFMTATSTARVTSWVTVNDAAILHVTDSCETSAVCAGRPGITNIAACHSRAMCVRFVPSCSLALLPFHICLFEEVNDVVLPWSSDRPSCISLRPCDCGRCISASYDRSATT